MGSLGAALFWQDTLLAYLRKTASEAPDASLTNMEIWRNIGLALAAAFGIVFTWWRSVCLGKQTRVAEQGLITDRFIKATEQLGSESMSVRIGAIYSLWRIAVDSESQSDKRAVLDMLCAFARAPYEPEGRIVEGEGEDVRVINPGKVREDIQVVMNILTRRLDELQLIEKVVLNLNHGIFPNINLDYATFSGKVYWELKCVNLSYSSLHSIKLSKVSLLWADFTCSSIWGG